MKTPLGFFFQNIEIGGDTLRLSRLFLPFFIDQVLRNLMSIAIVFMMGRYSDDLVASIGVAVQVMHMVIMLLTTIGVGGAVVISQYIGNDDHDRASKAAALTLLITTSLGLIFGISGAIFAPSIMVAMQLEAHLVPDAVAFFRIIAISGVLLGPLAAFYAISNSYGKPKNTMLTVMLMNFIYLIGCYIVIFRPFETPLEGALGIGIARGVSELVAIIFMIWLITRMKLGISLRGVGKAAIKIFKDILKIGIPGGIEVFSLTFSQLIATGFIASMGSVAITTRIYIQNITLVIFLASGAISQATAILIGRFVGAGRFDEADRLNWRSLRLTMIINSSLAFIVVLLRYPLLEIFTSNPEIINLGAGILIINFFAEVFRSINIIEQQALQAAGDARFKMVVSVCACWLIGLGFAWVLGFHFALGLYGFWIAFAMEEATRGIIAVFRWKSKKWTTKKLTN